MSFARTPIPALATDEQLLSYLNRLCGGPPFRLQPFDQIEKQGNMSLADYIRGYWEGRLSGHEAWHYQSADPYAVSTPEVQPLPPFDPWRQTAPTVGILGECAYCWEAVVPVPSVLTLVYTP